MIKNKIQSFIEKHTKRVNDHTLPILTLFYFARAKGLYVGDIWRLYAKKGKDLGTNTPMNTVQRLLRAKLVRLIDTRAGPNRCRKYYDITELGEKTYELYFNKKSTTTKTSLLSRFFVTSK